MNNVIRNHTQDKAFRPATGPFAANCGAWCPRRGPQDAWLSEIHVVSKAVRGHWPLEGSNPSSGRHPSPASRGRKPRSGCSIGQHLVPLATKLPPSSERKGEE